MLLSSVEDDEVELSPLDVIDHAESDPELTAMLSQARVEPSTFSKLAVG